MNTHAAKVPPRSFWQRAGTFIAYQLRGHVADDAQAFFGRPQSVQWVWWNLPPLRVYTWHKS